LFAPSCADFGFADEYFARGWSIIVILCAFAVWTCVNESDRGVVVREEFCSLCVKVSVLDLFYIFEICLVRLMSIGG
jgi:hypothetical protein